VCVFYLYTVYKYFSNQTSLLNASQQLDEKPSKTNTEPRKERHQVDEASCADQVVEQVGD